MHRNSEASRIICKQLTQNAVFLFPTIVSTYVIYMALLCKTFNIQELSEPCKFPGLPETSIFNLFMESNEPPFSF